MLINAVAVHPVETLDPAPGRQESILETNAFEKLYRANYPRLVSFARSFVRDDDLAKDVVQETFVSVWRRRSKLGESGSIRAYMYKVVRNKSLNALRNEGLRSVRQSEFAEESAGERVDAVDSIDAAALRSRMDDWISQLPDRQREALLLSRYEGLSHAEIADVMNVSARTVNNHLVAALRTLRNKVSAFEPSLLDA